ncbi:GntR family transcriptional regulator [Chitinophaga sp. 30R24]|uniref:GntR family transcriptional regulator n=1 Tax=Chitinophaga sp. 30R24 TaxID=3248838 RepID=UPI003B8F3635
MKKGNGFIYLQLADKIQTMISEGVYAAGEELLSVRTLHQEHGISTALQVYTHLEKKGWVEAREKSGYYVRYSHRIRPQLLPVTAPRPTAAMFRKTSNPLLPGYRVG